MSQIRVNNITNRTGIAGPSVAGIPIANSNSHFVVPTGRTGQRYADDGENIVRDGLVLYLDAKYSYPSKTGIGTTTAGAAAPAGSSTDVDVNTWYDMSGNENHGELINGVGYNAANGGSLVFDGVNDYIYISPSPSNILRTLTMECWFKSNGSPGGAGGYHVMFQKEGGFSGGAVYGLRANDNSYFYAMICYDDLSASQNQLQSTTNITNGVWYHIASTFDSNYNWKLFINGVLDKSTTLTAVPFQNNSQINIGTGDNRYTNGNISSVKIYNRALTAAEVLQNYNALRGRFGV